MLKESSTWNLAAEVVLLALMIVKENPDIEEATAILIARDEWDVASQMEAERTHEQETELTNPIEVDKLKKKFTITKIVDKF